MLTADEAAEIARNHGLGINDAVSLRALADDAVTAERIAARFAVTDETRFAKKVFGDGLPGVAEPKSAADLLEGNQSPLEGGNPKPGPSGDDGAGFAAALFHDGPTPN